MAPLIRRTRDRFRIARTLLGGGAGARGTIIYFLRHWRRDGFHQIDLKSGVSMVAPLSEPLLQMLDDIWIKRCYTPDFEIAAGQTIVDIGANLGAFSLYAASSAAGVRVVALEPSSTMFAAFQANLARNPRLQVTALHAACGGANRTASLYSRGFEGANSLFGSDRNGNDFAALEPVDVKTLDEVFQGHEIQSCDLLKLCCVGAEFEVLAHASGDTLRRIRRIAMQYDLALNRYALGDLVTLLQGRGFRQVRTVPYDADCGYCYAARGD